MRVAPGSGHNVVFTLYKSTLGTLATATATTMTVTVSNTDTFGINLTSSVAIKSGEYIAIRADRSASGAAESTYFRGRNDRRDTIGDGMSLINDRGHHFYREVTEPEPADQFISQNG